VKTRTLKLIAIATLVYSMALAGLQAVSYFSLQTQNQQLQTQNQQLHAFLASGKTASAKKATKTADTTTEIKKLIILYQQQNEATAAQQAAGQKELPGLLRQIENNIAAQDNRSIATAVKDATRAVEKYFQTHPVRSVP
jgi:hypothetical protein